MPEDTIQAVGKEAAPFCPICQTEIQPDEECGHCPECNALYHPECWQENGGCAVYGCKQVPATDSRSAIEIPVSFWGQEQKPCPACGMQIQAAAVRCRHCGATFASARPVDQVEHRQGIEEKKRKPGLQRGVLLLFAFSVFPFTAPIAAIAGSLWRTGNREAIRKLPSFYNALSIISLIIGGGQTVLIVLMGILYSMTRLR